MHESLRSVLGADSEGAVLVECEASKVSPHNVQSPNEQVEEWVAIADGGFVRRAGLVDEVMREREGQPAEESCGDTLMKDDGDEELAFWGF